MFTVFVIVAWSVMFFMHWVIYLSASRVFASSLPHWFLVLAILSATYLLASIGVRIFQHVTADWFYFLAATWLGVIFLTFSLVVLYEVIHFVTSYESVTVFSGLLIASIIFSAFALFQGRSISVREYTLRIKGLEKPLEIVHLSDIHVGTVHQKKYLEEIVTRTNKLSPDMVLVTGDLFDGSAPVDESILLPLNELNTRSFFSTGNHEVYEDLNKVRETISNLDMQLLENESVEFGGVQLIGVNDKQGLPKGETLGSVLDTISVRNDIPSVLMYHTPVEWDTARAQGIDVMLSGHTHNGQLFPFTILVRLAFTYINGLHEIHGQYLHVSPGTGTWGPPMRLGSRNQITLIHLLPEE